MDAYGKIQEDTKSKIQKGRSNFRKSPKDRISLSYLETRLEALENQWSLFYETHKKIIMEVTGEELQKSTYSKNDTYDQTEELYINYKSELKEAILTLKKDVNVNEFYDASATTNSTQSFTVKLPKIEIPNFSGKYTEWSSFRDLFLSLIHNNKGLDDVQKLHYLKSHLSGEAEQMLRHIPITACNYKTCWDQLEHRYNNKRFLANCVLKRFMNQKNVLSESSSAIKELLDSTNECLNALTNLGINVDSWDLIVIYIVSLKLDTESRKLWEVEVSKCNDELPKLIDFKNFLDHRFRSLEFLDNKAIKQSNVRNNVSKTMHAISAVSCIFCSDAHKLCNCKKFAKEDVNVRRTFAQTNKLCFNCLAPNHSIYNCRQSTNCRICKRRHHSLLHPKLGPKDDQVNNSLVEGGAQTSNVESSQGEASNIVSCFSNVNSQVLLATALVNVDTKNGTFHLRALLDQGSQASFIAESVVQMLGLRRVSNMSYISGLGSDQGSPLQSKWTVMVKIQSRHDPNFTVEVKAHVLNKLTSLLPERKMSVPMFSPQISAIELADPKFDTPSKIDILLGAEVYGQILMDGVVKGPPGSPIAQNTKFGWILSGHIFSPPSHEQSQTRNEIISMHTQLSMNDLLKCFWEQEELSSVAKKCLSEEEQQCEEMFAKTTSRDNEGRYVVKLPFKKVDPSCQYGNSYNIAQKRFFMLEKRLLKNQPLQVQYSEVMEEYLKLKHMEVVPEVERSNPKAVYLPHHAVVRNDKSTTKVRVVFDASCSLSNGTSLNNDLMVGPTLQPELRHLILRWRCYPISLVADIVKMYRQVKVAAEDVDFQRLLWRSDVNSELQHLRHLRVTFGTSSAPYLAVRSLQQLARDEGDKYPLAASRVLREFYMDDLMTGCENINEGAQIYQQMNELLKLGGFQLQKWSSSNSELLSKWDRESKNSKETLELKLDSVMKILGLAWNRHQDEFQYTVQLTSLEPPVTKRKMISEIAKLFDPLGWLAPVVTTAKIFIQRVWLSGIQWDEELPCDILKAWLEFREELTHLAQFKIPRWIGTSSNDVTRELQGFCDASNAAYAAAVYMRIVDGKGDVHVRLLAAKTKVAPVKQVSIPRLELCGAVLLANLLHEIAEVLEIPKECVYAWTDSSVVLSWLSSHPSRWKTYVANRVSEILTLMNNTQWSHVKSESNPADCASRGINPSKLSDLEIWRKGPEWLQERVISYSKGHFKLTDLEKKKQISCHTIKLETESTIIGRYSSLNKLLRIVAYIRRFLKLKKEKFTPYISRIEIRESLLTCVRLCQKQSFLEEITCLQTLGKIKKSSKLTSLCPFLDADGILRVGGRIQNAEIDENMKHPILLPYQSHFTDLIVDDAHNRTLHGGPQLMINFLRTQYWIINAKNLVRKVVRNCVVCRRHSAQTSQQMMGQLPTERVTVCRPFYQSGVDYAGPIAIRPYKGRGYRAVKGYIALFVCMTTRAIHLEVVSDMTSEAFLAAFKRFVARRGHCADLWSDNGTTFVGANRELKHLFQTEKSEVAKDIAEWLATNGTNWHFIPPHSPNFGGLWEAGVKSTKHHLKRVIGNSTLTFEEMSTLLYQIEACLNSRPLSQISNNPDDPYPLTPGHFLVGEPLLLIPDANFEQSNVSTLKRWQFVQRLLQDFWKRWSYEYLTQLQHRYKWSYIAPEPSVGDVVLVKEDDLPPSRWLYGIIKEKHVGADNLTRVVTLRCKGSIIKRPVSKLIHLPVTK